MNTENLALEQRLNKHHLELEEWGSMAVCGLHFNACE